MTTLNLQYRNSLSDPWTSIPDLTSVFPSITSGTLPVQTVSQASEPQAVIPGYSATESWLPAPGGTGADDHLILHVSCPPIPLSFESAIISFLINYKSATYFQIKYPRFGLGGWIAASLSMIEAKERHGMLRLSFRLAASLADALTNT